MNRRLFPIALAVMLGAGYSLAAFAQAKPETLVKQRQAALTLQGKYFGPLAAMAEGKLPYDANVVSRNAAYLDVLTKMAWDGFAPSTSNVKSGALPAVLTDTAKFKEGQNRLQSEVGKLLSASKSGDEAAVKAQIAVVRKSCSGCHDNFREKK